MHLAIDIRNKIASIGIYDHKRWLAIRKIGIQGDRTADEYALFLERVIQEGISSEVSLNGIKQSEESSSRMNTSGKYKLGYFENEPRDLKLMQGESAGDGKICDSIESCWISSVVPRATEDAIDAVRSVCGIESSVVGPGIKTGIKIRTDLPSEVGSDLICAAVAARHDFSIPCIIVDFGTAITFSAVNNSAEFIGAAFVPGFETQLESLKQNTAQLPEIKLEFPRKAIGTSTVEAIRSGIILGGMGMIEAMIARISLELVNDCIPLREKQLRMGTEAGAQKMTVIGSGNDIGREILSMLGHDLFRKNLVLDGIRVIAELNDREPARKK